LTESIVKTAFTREALTAGVNVPTISGKENLSRTVEETKRECCGARELKEMGFKETFVFGDRTNVYYSNATDKSLNFKVKRDHAFDLMQNLAEIRARKQRQEYEKMLESDNGNGDLKDRATQETMKK